MQSQETEPQKVVDIALSWLGTPYLHQASVKGAGCDCLGLIRGVWREIYGLEPGPLPIYSPDWAERGAVDMLSQAAEKYLTPACKPEPGSVLLFRMYPSSPVKHCGIMINQDEFIHAYWSRSVSRSAFGNWWVRRLAATYNFP
jgi:NlpC/P60 family putative phage cell wall peptidase